MHGLGGDARRTWTHSKSGKYWLEDFLPQEVPRARILTFGYDGRIKDTKSVGTIIEVAEKLLLDLTHKNVRSNGHPGPYFFADTFRRSRNQ